MKRLFIMLMAICTMCMWSVAHAEDSYFVAIGEVDHAKAGDPANAEAWNGHIANMGALYDQGVVFMAGPWENGAGGMIIVKAASLEAARVLLTADPAISAGIIKPVALNHFHAFFSQPDGRRISVEEFNTMMSSGMEKHHQPAAAASGSSGGSHEGGAMDMTIGDIGFIQIPATDPAASGAFYATHFGWEIMPMDFGGMQMTFFTAPGGQMGELSTMGEAAPAETGVTFYINTESIKAKITELTTVGSTVVMPPMALPEGAGHIALVTDPAGNVIGIWSAGE